AGGEPASRAAAEDETPPPLEPPARPVRTSVPGVPAPQPAPLPPVSAAAAARVTVQREAAAPAPARPAPSSRTDLPATRPAPAPAAARPAPAASPARPASMPAVRPAPAPVPAPRRVVVPSSVDEGKRGKITEVMRELSTRLAATLGPDSGRIDATQEEDIWGR